MHQLTTMPKGAFATFYKKMNKEKRNSYPAFRELKEFSQEIADNINKEFPGIAIVKDNCCYITDDYWEDCRDYVKENCQKKLNIYKKKMVRIIHNLS